MGFHCSTYLHWTLVVITINFFNCNVGKAVAID